ncbi:MAG TPA: tetratricopeptide repeat protein [bacterium]|nr:tetratricopeptide repeat protein [bacterium]
MRAPHPAAPAAAFLSLHLFPVAGVACLWGVDAGRYIPPWAAAVLAGLAAALFVPGAYRVAARSARRVASHPVGLAAGLTAVAAVVFVVLRSAGHLLGDGILHLHDFDRIRQAPVGFRDLTWDNNNAPLANWIVWAVQKMGSRAWGDSLTTFHVLATAAGVAWTAGSVWAAWRLSPGGGGRATVLAFLLTGGWMQLFAGYVEMYAALPPLVLLFLVLGAAGGMRGAWGAAFVLGVLIALHFAAVSLAPGLAFAEHAGSRRGTRIRDAVGRLAVAAVTAAGLLALLGFDAGAYLAAPREALLPLGEPGPRQAYGMFAPAHFLDVLNQLLLTAPAALMGLALLRRGGGSAASRFLGTAALGPLLLAFVVNPEVGAFRDWDALAFAAVPLTVWVAVRLATAPGPPAGRTAFLLGGAAGLHTLAWLAANADAAAVERRFVTLLEACPVSAHATAYGWESVAQLRMESGRREDACRAFENAALGAPDNPRYWYAAGRLHLEAGRPREAEDRLRKTLQLDPERVDALVAAGTLALARGDAAGGGSLLTRAVRLEPANADAWFQLARAMEQAGNPDGARAAAERFLQLEPSGPRADRMRDVPAP